MTLMRSSRGIKHMVNCGGRHTFSQDLKHKGISNYISPKRADTLVPAIGGNQRYEI